MPKLDEVVAAVQRIRDAGMTVLIIEQRMAECLEIADAPTSCRPAAC
jgi:branched-chain amino acid transport system ATP-binding protein